MGLRQESAFLSLCVSTENMTAAAVAKKFPPLQIERESQSLYSGHAKVRAEKQIYFAFFFVVVL
jgi:hypothetical protein